MNVDLQKFDQTKEENTWKLISDHLPALQSPEGAEQIDLSELFSPPISRKLAGLFLRFHRHCRTVSFLTDKRVDQGIASETRTFGKLKAKADIDAMPGIYIFVSLSSEKVLKVW